MLGFPTETPAIVGETITLSAEQANDPSTLPTIIALLGGADEAGCKVKLTGRLHGTALQHTYITEDNSFSTGDTKDLVLDLEELLEALSSDDAASISMTVHMSR